MTSDDPVSASVARPRFKYKIPEAARSWPSDPVEIVMRQITLGEEQAAAQVAGEQGYKFAWEATKHAIVSADGRPITWDDGGKERFIEGCSPKVRELLLKVYRRIHQPTPEVDADFFGSEAVVV
jgi:hypothetical protein